MKKQQNLITNGKKIFIRREGSFFPRIAIGKLQAVYKNVTNDDDKECREIVDDCFKETVSQKISSKHLLCNFTKTTASNKQIL